MTNRLDDIDLAIIRELRRNGRATALEVARIIALPRTTAVGRIKRLEGSGVIQKYSIQTDHAKLGLPVTCFIMVSFAPDAGRDQRDVARRLARIDNVESVNIIAGEWDMLLKMRARSIEEVGDVVLAKIRREPGVSKTLTLTSFQEFRGPSQ